MNRTRESVKREDHMDRFCEELSELHLTHSVGMIARPDQSHQIDNIDHAYTQLWQTLAQYLGRRYGLHRYDVSRARKHNVGLLTRVVVTRPLPHACAACAVIN